MTPPYICPKLTISVSESDQITSKILNTFTKMHFPNAVAEYRRPCSIHILYVSLFHKLQEVETLVVFGP